MPRLKHERPGLTYACPACDVGGQLYERTGNGNAKENADRPYRCNKCGTELHYVIERAKQGHHLKAQKQKTITGHYGVTAHKVAAMGPEDVGLSPIGERRRGSAD